MRRFVPGLLLLLPALLAAQDQGHGHSPTIEGGGVFPAGWSGRPDMGSKLADIKLETMPPGWHLTTAASGIVYRSADQVRGNYTVSAKLHLFPEGAGHREAFGIFIGGSGLDGAAQRYTYFIIRGDGTWKVKRRNGGAATDVTTGWTRHPAIVPGKADGSVANVLAIVVGADKVSFQVNGQEVHAAARSGVDTEGIVGLRINHNLSVHVESLETKQD